MNKIKFSHNWNNKLGCNIFTTIRKYSFPKLQYYRRSLESGFLVELNGKTEGSAVLRGISILNLQEIPLSILQHDVGYFDLTQIYRVFEKFGVYPGTQVLLLTFDATPKKDN